MPPAMYNPSGEARLIEEYTECCTRYGVRGAPSVEEADVVREFIEIHADAGAMNRRCTEDPESFLSRVVLYLGGYGQPGMDRFDCGRRYLLPLFFALGSAKYGPETVLELAMVYHQFQRGHRQHRRSTLKTFLAFWKGAIADLLIRPVLLNCCAAS